MSQCVIIFSSKISIWWWHCLKMFIIPLGIIFLVLSFFLNFTFNWWILWSRWIRWWRRWWYLSRQLLVFSCSATLTTMFLQSTQNLFENWDKFKRTTTLETKVHISWKSTQVPIRQWKNYASIWIGPFLERLNILFIIRKYRTLADLEFRSSCFAKG